MSAGSGRGDSELQAGEPLSEQELAVRRAAVAQRVAHLFRREQDNALMLRLRDAVLAYRLEQLR